MKRENINYLVVGCVVIAGLALMLYILFRLSGGVGENDRYYADYFNVGGLSSGTPVTYQGYKLGAVSAIEPLKGQGRTRYRVTIMVRDGWKIPDDSIARIYSEGLLAETVINIEEGASVIYLKPGSAINGQQGEDVFKAINSVASATSMLLTQSLKPLLDKLNITVTSMGGEMDSKIPVILNDVSQLVKTLNEGADRVPRILNEDLEHKLGSMVNNADIMSANLRQLSQGLLKTRKTLDRLLNQSQGTIGSMDKLLTDTHGTVTENRADLRASMIALRSSLEQVADYSETILHDLEGSARHMNEFSREIRDNPGLLLGGKPPAEMRLVNE
ncbi:MAG: MCE family protein [Gammaproteobacteria bacterium]|nr:MCE family protein [Gammaproteobacteria bacterium]